MRVCTFWYLLEKVGGRAELAVTKSGGGGGRWCACGRAEVMYGSGWFINSGLVFLTCMNSSGERPASRV